jgi:hypothetical protein
VPEKRLPGGTGTPGKIEVTLQSFGAAQDAMVFYGMATPVKVPLRRPLPAPVS